MVRALANVAPRHLLDRRLNPLTELREAAGREEGTPLRFIRPSPVPAGSDA
jgi:hypothetical protein